MVVLKHYRISLDVIARPLASFLSSREFVGAIADAMEGKDSFANSNLITNYLFPQRINMPTSMLVSFIVTSAQVIS